MLPDFKLIIRPNNQVSITLQNVIKKQKTHEKIKAVGKISKASIDRYVKRTAAENGLETLYSHNLKHEYIAPPRSISPLPLDLINRFQHATKNKPKEKLGYGKTPKIKYFSHKSGQKIRETGSVIDRLCNGDPTKCRVVTLTLPSSQLEAFQALSNYSGYAVNRLFQIVRRDYSLAHWFYVYEHQKRGALHLHICVFHDDPAISKEIGEKLCSKWIEILGDISDKTGINMLYSKGFGRTCESHEIQLDNQAMRLGCGAYFSKYASKNSGKHSKDINSINARKYPPSSFWGRSRELSKMCEKFSYKFTYEGQTDDDSEYLQCKAFKLLSQFNQVLSHSFAFKKEMQLPEKYGNGTLTICEGYTEVFYFSPKDFDEILQTIKNEFDIYKSSSNLDKRRAINY